MQNEPPGFEPLPNYQGELRLTNAQAKPIAEKLYLELRREFHGSATMKIISNLRDIDAREAKSQQVAYQLRMADGGAPLSVEKTPTPTRL